jgi:carbon-monoxide dehydrogenase catalytic subunit
MSKNVLKSDVTAEALIAKAQRDGVETMWDRQAAQKTQCGFGEAGVCCRICAMGPCRVSPIPGKGAQRGICGANAGTIVARNFVRMIAGGASAHSDHARDIIHAMHMASPEGPFKIRDEAKMRRIATEWEVENADTKETYALAHELANMALEEFGKPFGYTRFLKRAPQQRQDMWKRERLEPRAIDQEITTIMHSTHVGCASDIYSLLNRGLRTSLGDGWGGSMLGTEFSDILYGTPKASASESNLGVLDEEMVNIVLHGHDPNLAEVVVVAAADPKMVTLAKSLGAKGINVVGMCCTGNEITMRHGIKMAGNFYQQELAIITGAVEAMIVDVQCILPALPALAKKYHTRFISTSQKAKIAGDMYIEFSEDNAIACAQDIVKVAVENFANRDPKKVEIPDFKQASMAGYSVEAIIDHLDGVVNTQLEDKMGTVKPLSDAIYSGVLRGAAGVVGCNNPKVEHDFSHVTVIKELIKNDVIVVVTGCAAQAAAKVGLLQYEAKNLCGRGLQEICERANIPPVLHMGSCVDCSRILHLLALVACERGVDICELPAVGAAPEWMSEKAVSIASYVVASGINTYLGVIPQVTGSPEFTELLTKGVVANVGAKYVFEIDPVVTVEKMMIDIEEKRTALGI